MNLFLFILTVVSVAVAAVASFVAWRVVTGERARSQARVAALADAIEAPGGDASADDDPWHLHRVGSFRPEGHRVPERTGAVHQQERWEHAAPVASWEAPATSGPESAPRVVGLFDSGEPAERTRWQAGPVAALIGLLALAFVGSLVMVSGGGSGAATTASAAAPAPLELLSLRHGQREGSMEITGLVRNPAAAAPIERVSAVVFFFDSGGGFLASARAPLDFARLSPGEESPFVVLAPAPSHVSRYRVSFRRDDGVVPHVDRREKVR
jgi:hypothetical protein